MSHGRPAQESPRVAMVTQPPPPDLDGQADVGEAASLSRSQSVRELQQEVLDDVGHRQLRDAALSAAQLQDALPAQLLQGGLPFPVRRGQALLGGVDVMLQEGEDAGEGAVAVAQGEQLPLVLDANADRPALGVEGQREKDVLLAAVPDQEASQGSVL